MTRNEAIDLARAHALAAGERGHHANYLPTNATSALNWAPHEWVVDAIVSAAAERERATDAEMHCSGTVWLIESKFTGGESKWWNGLPEGAGQSFTSNPNGAVRFVRQEDADRVAVHLHMVCVTEHSWFGSSRNSV